MVAFYYQYFIHLLNITNERICYSNTHTQTHIYTYYSYTRHIFKLSKSMKKKKPNIFYFKTFITFVLFCLFIDAVDNSLTTIIIIIIILLLGIIIIKPNKKYCLNAFIYNTIIKKKCHV